MKSQKLRLALIAATLLSSGASYGQQGSGIIQNGGLESWHNYTVSTNPLSPAHLTIADGWQGSDSMVAAFAPLAALANITINARQQVFQTTDAHGGQSAAQLFSLNLGDSLGVQPGALTNGQISVDIASLMQGGGNLDPAHFFDLLTFKGGEPISGQVDSVSAWIKNGDSTTSANGAEFGFSAFALKQITPDSFAIVGEGAVSIVPDLTQYTRVSLHMSYTNANAQPDRLVVIFTSNNPLNAAPAPEYNSMKVDDVSYTMSTTGIQLPLMTDDAAMVYPNPAANKIYFNLKSGQQAENFDLRLTDLAGHVISRERLHHQVNGIDVSQYARGIYFYQLTNTKTAQQQRGKLILK
ncbi:MAG TPA: T9SS type A sorting domain-containing protein [Edaphocola sp.]|nr:T9SS type A sorting domain-containing protein [Edaphocola sp.]